MSMDGRIASADSSLDFLSTIGPSQMPPAADPWDFDAFVSRVDGIVIGASTLRWLLEGGHGWPHGSVPTWLLSHDPALAGAAGETAAPLVRREGDVGALFAEIEAAGCRLVWLAGGGAVAGQTLAADRIDEVVVTVAPTALGAGADLFGDTSLPLRPFRLEECRPLGGNAARLRWVRQR